MAAGVAALLVLAALAWWWRRRVRRENGEAECFARLERACRAGDAVAAYNALFRWLDVTRADGRPATIADDLLAVHSDDELRPQVSALEDVVLRGDARWDGAPLAATLRRLRRAGRRRRPPAEGALPALNPR